MPLSLQSKLTLKYALEQYFNTDELEGLVFELDIELENLKRGTQSEFVRSMIHMCMRKGIEIELMQAIRKHRPKINLIEVANELGIASDIRDESTQAVLNQKPEPNTTPPDPSRAAPPAKDNSPKDSNPIKTGSTFYFLGRHISEPEKPLFAKSDVPPLNHSTSFELIKITAQSRSTAVAGAIAGVIREHGKAVLQAIGAGAVNQAMKAMAIARGYLLLDAINIIAIPSFGEVDIDGTERTAVMFTIEPR